MGLSPSLLPYLGTETVHAFLKSLEARWAVVKCYEQINANLGIALYWVILDRNTEGWTWQILRSTGKRTSVASVMENGCQPLPLPTDHFLIFLPRSSCSHHLVARVYESKAEFRSALQQEKEGYTIYKQQVRLAFCGPSPSIFYANRDS